MDHPSRLEFEELNEYVRHETGVYFAWLSFFLTIVLGAMAWALKASVGVNGYIEHFPVVFMVLFVFFMIQISLGVGATTATMDDVEKAEERASGLLMKIGAALGDATYKPQRTVPKAYCRALKLAKRALIANLVFWPIVAFVVGLCWYEHWPLGRA